MDTREQADTLAYLRFVDQAEADLIGEALGKVEDPALATALESARADHERHTHEIDALFGECGEPYHADVPETVRQQAAQRLAAVRRARDEAAVVRVLLAAEQTDANTYEAADVARLPGDEGPVMHAHLTDEQRHVKELSRRVRA